MRQYLIYGSLERGMTPTQAEDFADRYKAKHPQAAMSDKASWDSWEARRKAGTLA